MRTLSSAVLQNHRTRFDPKTTRKTFTRPPHIHVLLYLMLAHCAFSTQDFVFPILWGWIFFAYNRLICKVTRLGAENSQFQYNKASHHIRKWEWKFLQNEIIETQTSFDTNFGGKLSFIPSILFPEGLHCCHTTYIFTAPTWSTTIITRTLCINLWALSQTDVVNLYIKFFTLRDTIEIGDRRWKQAQREWWKRG